MKEFLSVKEFSKFTGIEQTTLRYWDDIGLFSPAKRDPDNNYRYYSPEQIIAVNFITVLSELNVPLKTIGEMEKGRTPDSIVRLIEQQERLLDMEMRRLRECYSIIHTRLELINYGTKLVDGFSVVDGVRLDKDATGKDGTWVDETRIGTLEREERMFILGPRTEFKEGESFYEPFMKFCDSANELRMNLSFPIGGYHEGFDGFMRAPGRPDNFFSLDPTGNRSRVAGRYLIGFTRGYYGEFGNLHERMAAYMRDHSISVTGPVFSLYLHDEICLKDPKQYLVQVSVAIA
ncbi:MAG: MerR family transcriptional regulator [Clostridiales bacterium]|nr:MerR family transcriptional regulator [Clostridiales bacterium]